ncbi:MAG: DUF4358 domain-containing protein [Lachnospiraceae bacterium]|nr:DUF4358 domain-containing protein [Lachnospiraceae bacterium]
MKKTLKLATTLAAASMLFGLAGCGEAAQQQGAAATPAATAAATQAAEQSTPAAEALKPTEIYAKIKSAYTLPEMYEADADWLMNYYGIDAAMLSDYVFAEADEVHADRVIILKVADEANIPVVEEKLNAVLAQLSSPEMLSYLPEQADIIKAAAVKKQGDTLYLVISADAAGIEGVITDGLAGK